MPGLSGDEVCRRIRGAARTALLPVIMVTGDGHASNLEESLAAGASDFVRKPYDPAELRARVRAAVRLKRKTDQLDNAESLLFALARTVEARDTCTGDHCTRLAHAAVMFGRALGLEEPDLGALRRGGVVHDIGKLAIPDRILLKPGKLDETEWRTMRTHTVIGARICAGLKSMERTLPIIRHHHERWDGSGYPEGLAGEQIPLLARVFQIADIYDALRSERPYKRPLSGAQVVEILEDETRKGWRDPELMATFLDLVQRCEGDFASPLDADQDEGQRIFEDIVATGAISAPPASG